MSTKRITDKQVLSYWKKRLAHHDALDPRSVEQARTEAATCRRDADSAKSRSRSLREQASRPPVIDSEIRGAARAAERSEQRVLAAEARDEANKLERVALQLTMRADMLDGITTDSYAQERQEIVERINFYADRLRANPA